MKDNPFRYPLSGPGRPQVVLIGNGLERGSNQMAWEELLRALHRHGAVDPESPLCKGLPFPLQYQLITTPLPAAPHLSAEELKEQDRHLSAVMKGLRHESNRYLDELPKLGADHIFSTNYSYCMESAFFPVENFGRSERRSRRRLYLAEKEDGSVLKEQEYRLHTCYLADCAGRKTGLWHIHGECSVAGGIILSHDRYGRLLERIAKICAGQSYRRDADPSRIRAFTSWPELFLYADVYVLGLGLTANEFDLWWLIHRKQRERHSDGRIFFYERSPSKGIDSKHLLMQANGVVLCNAGCDDSVGYDQFYPAALEDIREKIAQSREMHT